MSGTFILRIYTGTLNSTGTSFDFIPPHFSPKDPSLDYSMTGSGTSGDPYVWSMGAEFNSIDMIDYHIPTSTQFISCWGIVDLRLDNSVWNNDVDLGNNMNIVFNDSFSTSATSNSPANKKSDSLNFNSFKQGLMIIAFFVSIKIV